MSLGQWCPFITLSQPSFLALVRTYMYQYLKWYQIRQLQAIMNQRPIPRYWMRTVFCSRESVTIDTTYVRVGQISYTLYSGDVIFGQLIHTIFPALFVGRDKEIAPVWLVPKEVGKGEMLVILFPVEVNYYWLSIQFPSKNPFHTDLHTQHVYVVVRLLVWLPKTP
jgi:hypothetical protein